MRAGNGGAERSARPEEEPVRRTIFTDEHEQFRQMVRAFLEKECVPHTAEWLEAGVVSREAWRKAGELGLLGWMVPEEYGGLGIRDFRYSVVIAEEIAATGTQGIALALHNDVVAPYLTDLTNAEQKQPVAAGLRDRRAAGRDRHVRARRGLRPQAGQGHRPPRRRPLRPQRDQDLHQQRPARQPRHRGGADRPGGRAPGDEPARGRGGVRGLRARAASSTRSGTAPRTPPSCSSATCGCRPRTCSARRAGASTT